MNGLSTVLAGLAVGAGITIGSLLLAQPLAQVADQQKKISVKGYAERSVDADVGVWRATLKVRATTLPGAYAELGKANAAVAAWLADRKLDAKQLVIKPADVQAQYALTRDGMQTSQVTGYVLTQGVQVAGRSVDEITALHAALPALLSRGVEFEDAKPEYYVSGIEDIKLSLVADATANARRRAEEFAKSGGLAVGTLRSASQGVFQIVPPGSGEVADFGRYDTTTIAKTVKLVVSVEYALAR